MKIFPQIPQFHLIAIISIVLSSCTDSHKKATNSEFPELNRPNILWISLEDLSPHLGCYGDTLAKSPVIDQLAKEGIRYTNVFTSAPVCAPCRSGIITGMNQSSIGTQHMRVSHAAVGLPTPYSAVPPPYVKTFTEYLRAAGYYCTNNSKNDYQFETPITAWDENGGEASFVNRKDKSQPFFAIFNFTETHESQNWRPVKYTNPDHVTVPPYYPDTRVVRENLATMYDNVIRADEKVWEVLHLLEESGEADNTIVIFWTDHGDGLPRAKRWLYESGLKVPLIVKYPDGRLAGTSDDRLISSIDFGPTVLSLAEIEVPVHMQGQAFLGKYEAEQDREFVFGARDRFDESYDMVRTIRDDRFRYIRNYYPQEPYIIWVSYRNRMPIMQELLRLDLKDSLNDVQKLWLADSRPVEELYDCLKDPHNINNLAADPEYMAQLLTMRKMCESYMQEINDLGWMSEDQMVELFWPGGIQPETIVPKFIINSPKNIERHATESLEVIEGPCEIKLQCPTNGASIAYTFEEGGNAAWKLYSAPVSMDSGEYTMRAKAIRIGYKESEEVHQVFKVVN
jgi:arylsulfatase A-like enzyme